jgi:hypothetical protein
MPKSAKRKKLEDCGAHTNLHTTELGRGDRLEDLGPSELNGQRKDQKESNHESKGYLPTRSVSLERMSPLRRGSLQSRGKKSREGFRRGANTLCGRSRGKWSGGASGTVPRDEGRLQPHEHAARGRKSPSFAAAAALLVPESQIWGRGVLN